MNQSALYAITINSNHNIFLIFFLVCPNNIPVFECGGDPCNGASCPGYPDAVCLPDYCGHCHAVWYVGGERVTCSGKAKKVSIATHTKILL